MIRSKCTMSSDDVEMGVPHGKSNLKGKSP